MDSLINPNTLAELEALLGSSPHALLLSGPPGSGKSHAARHFAAKKLAAPDLDSYPYFKNFQPISTTLGIDQIRELQKFLRLKTLGDQPIRRVVLIEDAHLMTGEAQNALLKSLEEPPADTIIILTSPATLALKDTIYSRVQKLDVLPVTKEQVKAYFQNQFSATDIDKAHLMSGGLAGLLHALLHQQDHPLGQATQTAKQIIGASTFDRLTQVDTLAKQKDTLPTFLQACKLIATTGLHQATQKGNRPAAKRWHHTLNQVHQAESALAHNPNPKLLLTHLFIQM